MYNCSFSLAQEPSLKNSKLMYNSLALWNCVESVHIKKSFLFQFTVHVVQVSNCVMPEVSYYVDSI